MNQEEREALTHQTTQRMVACLHQTTNREETIRSLLTTYGLAIFAAGGRAIEDWIGHLLASLPIPILITRTHPEGSGEQEPVVAYHWKTLDREGDTVRCCIHGKQGCLRLRGKFVCFPDVEEAKTLIKRFRTEGYTSSDSVERHLPEWEFVCLNWGELQRTPALSRPMQRVS